VMKLMEPLPITPANGDAAYVIAASRTPEKL